MKVLEFNELLFVVTKGELRIPSNPNMEKDFTTIHHILYLSVFSLSPDVVTQSIDRGEFINII